MRRAVVIETAWLGDVVFTAPLARALSSRAELGFVARPQTAALAAELPGVSRVHVLDKDGPARGLGQLLRLARELRGVGYDTAYLTRASLRSAVLARSAGIHRIVGPRSPWIDPWLTASVVVPAAAGHVERRLALLGADDSPGEAKPGRRVTSCPVAARPGNAMLRGALGRPASAGAGVGLAIGSRYATKRWPPEHFAALAAELVARAIPVTVIGSEAERPLAERVVAGLRAPVRLAVGGGPTDLLRALAAQAVVVGGDSGPVHLARALGVPVVAIFGPTDPAAHEFDASDRPLRLRLGCQPCSDHGQRRCPLLHHRCMRDLHPSEVIEAAMELLDRREPCASST